MGLSAGQARLLSITARKSDCEYQSMQFSHQKLAISRQLENVSNEYQNSLEQTKLVYDFYGTGNTDTQLSYGILMKPSELNGYYPNLLTDASGRVVLNEQYAAAARAAGIPQEGLNGIPSDTVRNKFIQALADNEIITQARADKFMTTSYNQLAGIGAVSSTAITTTEGHLDDLLAMLELNGCDKIAVNDLSFQGNEFEVDLYLNKVKDTGTKYLSLKDLLTNGSANQYTLTGGREEHGKTDGEASVLILQSANIFLDTLFNQLSTVLDTGDAYTQSALQYAYNETAALIDYSLFVDNDLNSGVIFNSVKGNKGHGDCAGLAQETIGLAVTTGESNMWKSSKPKSSISLNNLAQAFLTTFAKYMEGLALNNNYNAEGGKISDGVQNLVTKDPTYVYFLNCGASLTEDEMQLVNFYDTILNQLCTRGWTENREVDDNQYLQEMLQGGMMFLTKIKDDGYYYQGNYATDSYIKTIEDETAIAQAEAKYSMEKQKLNSKENSLDMKMKKLDTEISALTTEYDTVKGTIQKNIERTFKRYNA